MKLIKRFLGIMALALIPLSGMALADDCFDTVIDTDGTIFYIDPNDKYSVFEERDQLVSIYGNRLECSGNKKVYTSEEYLDFIFDNLYSEAYKDKNDSSAKAIIELIMLILSWVAMWKIFVKAGKPGIYSLIPIYNIYHLSDIAGLSGLFNKALICLIAGILVYFFIPMLGMILIILFGIFVCIVNYNVARNFGWSAFACVLYVVFNSIAMLILAFGNDKYYMVEQKEKIEDEIRKRELENLVNQGIKGKENMGQNVGNINKDTNYYNNPQKEEIKLR